MKFTKTENYANQPSRKVWVAKNAAADHFVTIEQVGDEFQVSESRKHPEGGWAGQFHGTCSTFLAAEGAGLSILRGDQWAQDDGRRRQGVGLFSNDDRRRIEGMALEMLNALMEAAVVLKAAADRGDVDEWGENAAAVRYAAVMAIVRKAMPTPAEAVG